MQHLGRREGQEGRGPCVTEIPAGMDEQEARLNTLMLGRARSPIVLSDADKFGRRLTYGVGKLAAGAQVVTDARLSADWHHRLAELGVGLTLAEAP